MDIVDEFNLPSRHNVYYWERKKAYPQYVKDWMEGKLKEQIEFEAEQDLKTINKRLRALEKAVGLEGKKDVSGTE
jgi:hypothetical protein